MIQTRKIGVILLICFFSAIAILGFTKNDAESAELPIPLPTDYSFVFNGIQKPAGSEIEMKTSDAILSVTAGNQWAPASDIKWVSSSPGIIQILPTDDGDSFVQLKRIRPGYSTITAVVKYGTNEFSISCLVKVNLSIDYQAMGAVTSNINQEKIVVMNVSDAAKKIELRYVNDDVAAVSGSAISTEFVSFESDNVGVATVSSDGFITAVGSGKTTITVTSNTLSSKDKPMETSFTLVVSPSFSLTYDDVNGTHSYNSGPEEKNASLIYSGIPSNFVIVSNAKLSKNLNWVVKDCSGDTKKILTEGTSSKMTYTLLDSGNVMFSNVKSGTYEIYAFADKNYNVDTNAPYAYMKIIVPIDLGSRNIVMTVGDTYNIVENSNIPGVGVFVNQPGYIGPDDTITTDDDDDVARFNATNYVITARRKGTVKIRLMYDSNQKLYDHLDNPYFDINVTVIDGISLSTTNATLYTKGTLQLDAIVTDSTIPITWVSSNPAIATVKDGLVTGVKAGSTTITATQVINGIVKKATCNITVQQSVTNIEIDPDEITLAIDAYTTLHATISPDNLSGVKLQWKSSNEAVVKVVESSALTATIQGVSGGNAVISAINQDNVVVGYCHVKVQQPVTSITLSETNVTVDLTTKRLQLRAIVYPENALNKNIKWSTTDPTKANVDQNGLVTILKPGTVTIVATSDDNAKVTAYCNITIQIPVVSITLDETAKTMYVGQSARLSYVVLPTNASNNLVTWTSTNPTVATVDATGNVSAKTVGTTVIILKSLDGGYSVYCTITVKSVATGIKLDVSELNLKTTEYYYLKPTLNPKNSTENNLAWESSDTKVAIVDENGKVTAKKAGIAIITVRTEAGGIAYCKVTVTEKVKGLILNFTEKTIFKGEDFKLKVSVTPSSATDLRVTWKSSNPKIATVAEDGEVEGLMGGVAIITCTTTDGGYSATCVVTVRETVTTVKLDKDSYNLGVDKTVKLNATVSTETATNKKVAWSSSNEKVAVVNQSGKVTGKARGYATITATALDGSEVDATCEIRVVQPVSSVTISKTSMSMYVGESKDLNAGIKPTNATYKKAKWSTSDPSIAIVDEDGTVIGIKAGSVTITAEASDNSGKKALCYVWVYDRVPSTGITLQDKKLTMVSGEEKVVQLVLIPATSTDSYTWSSDNNAVAKVDKKTGKITARSTGTAYVTVMTDTGKTATVEVTVIGLNVKTLNTEQYTTYDQALEVQGATGKVTWRSDNPLIVVVYSDGTISTRGTGTANIVANVNGRKLTCKVVVKKMS